MDRKILRQALFEIGFEPRCLRRLWVFWLCLRLRVSNFAIFVFLLFDIVGHSVYGAATQLYSILSRHVARNKVPKLLERISILVG